MRKLQFIANYEHHHGLNACHVTQEYVTNLLAKQLSQYGFKAETNKDSTESLAVSVENQAVALGVNCRLNQEDGFLLCEISARADEAQPWFKKIEMQSVIKQLANAVENTLKADHAFSQFEWKV
ncbi:hypothetical protein [Acinetobacter silvestris]|uniref:Uncharacterized protein n=1 Tax=Acinetobacter silvestris TaxID=1977882 RepID=A0A1Y3CHK1_9GAMM|nr:hypothetical protein [Acinetobacter silvestris]OTG66596.1 hypothetical protein B9T28_04935 [Acinetobacter silvestris]